MSLFSNKVGGWELQVYLKNDWHICFPVNFTKILGIPFLQNAFGELLLKNWSYDPNLWKISVKKFSFSKIAGPEHFPIMCCSRVIVFSGCEKELKRVCSYKKALLKISANFLNCDGAYFQKRIISTTSECVLKRTLIKLFFYISTVIS